MNKRKIAVVLLAIFSLGIMPFAVLAETDKDEVKIYVSPDGNDQNTGTFDKPFATIDKARLEVRKLNGAMKSDISVILRGGTYRLTKPLEFDSADSAKGGFKINYMAFEGEKPVLTGAKEATGWEKTEKGLYKTNVGAGVRFRQLIIDGVKGQRARYPDVDKYLSIPADLVADGIPVEKGVLEKINPAADTVELGVNVEWMSKRFRVKSWRSGKEFTEAVINPIEWEALKGPQGAKMSKFRSYWFENALQFLDSPGEWFLDRGTGDLYYYPMPYEDMSKAKIEYPVAEQLIKINGSADKPVTGLAFKGITFTGTGWTRPDLYGFVDVQANSLIPAPGEDNVSNEYRHKLKKDKMLGAFHAFYANNTEISGCIFKALGGSGITFDTGGENITIQGNYIADTAGTGIEVGSDYYRASDKRMYHKNVDINNNYITNIANEYYGGIGILAFYIDGLKIEHNHIAHVPYSGISANWGWGPDEVVEGVGNYSIRYNRVEDIIKTLRDSGAIYVTNPLYGTNVIEENYIIGSARTSGTSVDGVALYHDGAAKNWNTRRNVIENFNFPLTLQYIPNSGQKASGITVEDNYSSPSIIQYRGDVSKMSELNLKVINSHIYKHSEDFPPEAKRIMENAGLEEKWKSIMTGDKLEIRMDKYYFESDIDDTAAVTWKLSNNTDEDMELALKFDLTENITVSPAEPKFTLKAGEKNKRITANLIVSKDCKEASFTIPYKFVTADGHEYKWSMGIRVQNEQSIVVNIADEGYVESGTFAASGLGGYNANTRYGYSTGANAKWTPDIPSDGMYNVKIYKIVHSVADKTAKIEVVYDGGNATKEMDFTSGSAGWVDLGTYHFKKGKVGYVQNTRGSTEKENGFIRTSAVAFTRVIEGNEADTYKQQRAISRMGNVWGLFIDKPYALNNGEKVEIAKGEADTVPFIENGRTYVPLRFISESMGASVSWDDERQEAGITLGTVGIRLWKDSVKMLKNRVEFPLDAAPILKNDRLYVPLRVISEALNMSIMWDDRGLILFGSPDSMLSKEADASTIDYIVNYFIRN